VKVGLALVDPATVVDQARKAEDAGYDYVACGEHLYFNAPTPNAFVALAAAAGATRQIRLVSAVSLVPQYPAVMFAKLVASLDVVSGGRFEVGVGAGGDYPPEFLAVGVDTATRFRRVEEAVSVLRRLCTGERVSFAGEFTRFDDLQLDPKPLQQPAPPVWLVGRKDIGIRRAGRLADMWLPFMVTPSGVRQGLVHLRQGEEAAARPSGAVGVAMYARVCCDPDGDWARRTGIEAASRLYKRDFTDLADRYLFLGTPEQVIERIAAYANEGVRTVIMSLSGDEKAKQRSALSLREVVVPALRDL
jgi:probable F420-dependent oxidoreductase